MTPAAVRYLFGRALVGSAMASKRQKIELAKNCDMLLQSSACRQPGAKPKKALPGGNIGIPHAIAADMARDIGKPGFRTSAYRIRVDRIRFRSKLETVQVAESSGGW